MTRLTVTFAIIFALLLGGCAQRTRQIYNVDRPMPHGVERLSPVRIRDLIIAAGKSLEWSMTPIAPGHLEATDTSEKVSATVEIYYTPARLQIQIGSTVNLFQTATTVHDRYNRMVKSLESGIVDNLSAAAGQP